jgi:phosphoribosyl 1,2-cyclic phosphate phosphodiesterase
MKNKTEVTILGCGSSLGVPRIDGYWGRANKNNSKNYRTRCSIFVKYKNINVIIDTSPDIKYQILKNKIKNIDAVIYTHEHADQTHGINELRPFYWKNKKKIPLYASLKTIRSLKRSFSYLFIKKSLYYEPIFKEKIVNKKNFKIKKKNQSIFFSPLELIHGDIKSYGFLFNEIAYLPDCNKITLKSLNKLSDLKLLIIDCLKFKKHPTHLNFNSVIKYINIIKPNKTILTNLHSDIDYNYIRNKLNKVSKKITPAYDNQKFFI